jgi:hypothetical protein
MKQYRATKYDSAAHEVVAILSDWSEGFGTGRTGEVDAPTGYVALVHLDDTSDLAFDDHTNYPVGDHAGETAREYGVTADDVRGSWLVTHNSQGFVSCERFDSREDAERAFAEIEAAYAEWSDDDMTALPAAHAACVDVALDAFWQSIATAHPDMTTGDLDPETAQTFETAARAAVTIWLELNRPAGS